MLNTYSDLQVFYGSDGTRTRDLRRDRPVQARPPQPTATRNYQLEQAFRTNSNRLDRLQPATARQSLCSTRVVGLVPPQATVWSGGLLLTIAALRVSTAYLPTSSAHDVRPTDHGDELLAVRWQRLFLPVPEHIPEPRKRETERILGLYEREAHKYDREMRVCEKLLFGGGREWACSRAEGDVLEIAVGTGRNLPYYSHGVRLTGVELSPAMLEIARRRARELGRDADLRVGDAQALDFPDDRFDSVVCTLSLCTIPDDRAAVSEVRRVLRPGGRFLLLEHVRSPVLPARVVERLLEPLMLRFEGDHLLREPLDHLRAEGFDVERDERSKLGLVERVAARKP